MNSDKILARIKASITFDDKVKKILTAKFDTLNSLQKESILKILDKEKSELLNFLKSLKDGENMTFSEVKFNIEHLQIWKILKLESAENRDLQTELSNLISSLDFV